MTDNFGSKFNYFRFLNFNISADCSELTFSYSLADQITLTETLKVEDPSPIKNTDKNLIHRSLRLCHLALGISYYKTIGFKEMQAEISPGESEFFVKLYKNGLGEFAYQNNLSNFNQIRFAADSDSSDIEAVPIPSEFNKTILPIGGGKDSLLSLEILKGKIENLFLFALARPGQADFYQKISKLSGIPIIIVTRKIDPLISELNKSGAYNGHVPFSAILAFSILTLAPLLGIRRAILSNEHSASFPNLSWAGQEINHQYSKSLEFENDFINFNNRFGLRGFEYFSLLRQFSELSIVREFSKFNKYDYIFTSCNRYFATNKKLWCCNCAKCNFFFILASAFYDKPRLLSIFGENLFEQTENFKMLDELCGFSGHKPFDCVGVPEEAALALLIASRKAEWQEASYIKSRNSRIKEISLKENELTKLAFSKSAEHNIPQSFENILNGYFRYS